MTPEELSVWTTFAAAAMNGYMNTGQFTGLQTRAAAVADIMLAEWRKRRKEVEEPSADRPSTVGEYEAMLRDPLKRVRHCGCIVCLCRDEERCHGCGARMCDMHQPSKQRERLDAALIEKGRES